MSRRSPTFSLCHIVWATAGRRRLLLQPFDESLLALLGAKAAELNATLVAAGVAADHVHLVIRQPASVTLADVVRRMKGGSSYEAAHRRLFPHRLAWQNGYWAESLCPGCLPLLRSYLRGQRAHHDDSHPAERWQSDDGCEPAGGGP